MIFHSQFESNILVVYRLVHYAAGLEDYAFRGQLVTQMSESSLCQYPMLSKSRLALFAKVVV